MTSPIVNAAKIVGRGFLLGVGFSIAFGIFAFLAERWSSHRTQEQAESFQEAFAKKNLGKDIALTNVEEVKRDGTVVIIGFATNKGKAAVRGFHIQANLFNHDKFVDQYSTYITGTLEPGKSQYFKISCGCKDTAPAEHDSYKLEVLGGY
ncbi:MAG TPA: FxLYD domain-containing protein [Steroidobacteraceae bacterium]